MAETLAASTSLRAFVTAAVPAAALQALQALRTSSATEGKWPSSGARPQSSAAL